MTPDVCTPKETERRQPLNILNEQTENVPINSIRPHERNVNEGDLGQIIQSIDENGFCGTVIVQKSTGKILRRLIERKILPATQIVFGAPWQIDAKSVASAEVIQAAMALKNRETRLRDGRG